MQVQKGEALVGAGLPLKRGGGGAGSLLLLCPRGRSVGPGSKEWTPLLETNFFLQSVHWKEKRDTIMLMKERTVDRCGDEPKEQGK